MFAGIVNYEMMKGARNEGIFKNVTF